MASVGAPPIAVTNDCDTSPGMRARLIKRLRPYWKMEALNVVFIPAFASFLIVETGGALTWPFAIAALACSALLVVGTAALRMELAELERRPDLAARLLAFARAARAPAMALCGLGVAAAGWQVQRDGDWTPAGIGAVALAALAVLEYVNYYVVQLQHFDHAEDFRRLMSGRGFRESHLAKALRRSAQSSGL